MNPSSGTVKITFEIGELLSVASLRQGIAQLLRQQSQASAHEHLRSKKRVRYTDDDDESLLRLRKRSQLSWDEIQQQFFPERSSATLQVRYGKLKYKTRRTQN